MTRHCYIEGPDGCGKTTLAPQVATSLMRRVATVYEAFQPWGRPKDLYGFLRDRVAQELHLRTCQPYMDADVVLWDRGPLSSLAYNCIAPDGSFDAVGAELVLKLVQPGARFAVLDIESDVLLERLQQRDGTASLVVCERLRKAYRMATAYAKARGLEVAVFSAWNGSDATSGISDFFTGLVEGVNP